MGGRSLGEEVTQGWPLGWNGWCEGGGLGRQDSVGWDFQGKSSVEAGPQGEGVVVGGGAMVRCRWPPQF